LTIYMDYTISLVTRKGENKFKKEFKIRIWVHYNRMWAKIQTIKSAQSNYTTFDMFTNIYHIFIIPYHMERHENTSNQESGWRTFPFWHFSGNTEYNCTIFFILYIIYFTKKIWRVRSSSSLQLAIECIIQYCIFILSRLVD
jgi:hypothetical protein